MERECILMEYYISRNMKRFRDQVIDFVNKIESVKGSYDRYDISTMLALHNPYLLFAAP